MKDVPNAMFATNRVSSVQCVELCNHHMQMLALFDQEKGCFCASSPRTSLWKHNPKGHLHVYFTDYSLRQCRYVSFMDPQNPKYPPIGVVSIPGSGNTWTRDLLERMCGVVATSIYADGAAMKQNIFGSLESFKSRRATFVKAHRVVNAGNTIYE